MNEKFRGVTHDGFNNPAGYRRADAVRRRSNVAAQPGLGVWTVGCARHSAADLGRVVVARPHLKVRCSWLKFLKFSGMLLLDELNSARLPRLN
jgi:hypothetical protein